MKLMILCSGTTFLCRRPMASLSERSREQSVRRLRDVIWAYGRTSTCVSVCPQHTHTLSTPKQPRQPTATESPERLVGGLLNSSRIVLVWRCTRVARSTPDKRRQGETTGSDDELRREAPPALLARRAALPGMPASRGRARCQGAHAQGSSNVGRQ